ncbi:ubiquinol-cytochrome c reductase iron-sulfur subunit [Nannocystis pusilla]|uniref:QcrA and Rieske domain-containing protein n=1 Tax=Nannocystis pusilla TaxID=889268 RepID=UPI003B7E82FA
MRICCLDRGHELQRHRSGRCSARGVCLGHESRRRTEGEFVGVHAARAAGRERGGREPRGDRLRRQAAARARCAGRRRRGGDRARGRARAGSAGRGDDARGGRGQKPVLVVREGDGYEALLLKCTHMGCTPGWNATERSLDCPCHGSRFDAHGAVLKGPAKAPLEKFAVASDGSTLRFRVA